MKRYFSFLLCLTVMILVGDACQNPLEGVTIGLKDPIQAGVIECRFYDPAGNSIPRNSRIVITGPDADLVVTTLNTKKYRINEEGVLLVAVSPSVTPSTTRPFRFTIAVITPDYLTIVQPFTLTNANRQTRRIALVSLIKPPISVIPARQVTQAGNGGALNEFSLVTVPPSSGDVASVQIPAGTVLTDRDGVALGGELTMQMIQTNARTGDGAGQIPGGPVFSNIRNKDGSVAAGNVRTVSIAGSVSLMAFNEKYQLSYQLSKQGRFSMDLNPATFNPTTGRAIQAGDSIPLYSYDALAGLWQQENSGAVVRNPATGRLVMQASFNHALAYIAAWTTSVCTLGPIFAVQSKLANVDVLYRCQLVDATTGAPVTTFFANVNNNARIGIYNQDPGRQYKLRIFDETDAWGKGKNGGMIAESKMAYSCDQTPVVIDLNSLPVPPVMKLEFQFSCPQGTRLDESLVPSLIRTQYSEVGKENWYDLIIATRTQRSVASYKLQIGRRYDLRASTDGGATWPLRQNDYLIDKPEWALKIKAEMYCK